MKRFLIDGMKLYYPDEETAKAQNPGKEVSEIEDTEHLPYIELLLNERIDKTIEFWRGFHNATQEEVKRYHNWFAEMDRLEDIEVRMQQGRIVWRYYDKNKWNYIEL